MGHEIEELTLRTTTPSPSLLRRGIDITWVARDTPLLNKEGLGVVELTVRKVSEECKLPALPRRSWGWLS